MTIEQLPAAERIATETALKEAGKRRWLWAAGAGPVPTWNSPLFTSGTPVHPYP